MKLLWVFWTAVLIAWEIFLWHHGSFLVWPFLLVVIFSAFFTFLGTTD